MSARAEHSQRSHERPQDCERAHDSVMPPENARNLKDIADVANERIGILSQEPSQRASHARTRSGAGRGRGGLSEIPAKTQTGGLPALLTTRQVAESLQLNTKTVERMAREGRLPSLRISGRVRFLPCDIASWLAARRTACHD